MLGDERWRKIGSTSRNGYKAESWQAKKGTDKILPDKNWYAGAMKEWIGCLIFRDYCLCVQEE